MTDTQTVALRIAAGVLGYTAEFVSHEETRYFLNGVYVEPAKEGVIAVATDGHRLIAVSDQTGFIERPAILRAERNVWAKCRSKHDALLTVEALGEKEKSGAILARLSPSKGAAESVILDEIDGTFPEWRKVVPVVPPTGATSMTCFQARYLGAFDGLARVGGGAGGIRVLSDTTGAPAVVVPSCPSAWPWLGILMPMCCDKIKSAKYPAWLGLKSPRVKATAARRAA